MIGYVKMLDGSYEASRLGLKAQGKTKKEVTATLEELTRLQPSTGEFRKARICPDEIQKRKALIKYHAFVTHDTEAAASVEMELWRDVFEFIGSGKCLDPEHLANITVITSRWMFRRS